MSYKITVENIKCGGCASTITSKLNALDAVEESHVDVEKGVITVSGSEVNKETITQLLLKLGYPENGTAEGIKAAKAKAKSFISCAVGKLSA